MRDRAFRRHKEKVKQAKRMSDWESTRQTSTTELDPSQVGRFKDGHFGCGCAMCKPHKHGMEKPIRKKRKRLAELELKDAKLREKYAEL